MHCLRPRQCKNISAKTLMALKPQILSPANLSPSMVFKASVEQGQLPDDWSLLILHQSSRKGTENQQ